MNGDLFWLTPAFLVAVLGREMVHMDEYARTYKTNLIGINSEVAAFREIEAYSWELHRDTFPRTFKAHDLFDYMHNSERTETEVNYECAQWEASKAIEDTMTGPRHAAYAKTLASWLQEDPWVSQVWLPQHPNWATQKADPMPVACR